MPSCDDRDLRLVEGVGLVPSEVKTMERLSKRQRWSCRQLLDESISLFLGEG